MEIVRHKIWSKFTLCIETDAEHNICLFDLYVIPAAMWGNIQKKEQNEFIKEINGEKKLIEKIWDVKSFE